MERAALLSTKACQLPRLLNASCRGSFQGPSSLPTLFLVPHPSRILTSQAESPITSKMTFEHNKRSENVGPSVCPLPVCSCLGVGRLPSAGA